MALTLRFVARTDMGLRRSSNQDSGYAGPHLIAVADGMGGAAAGDLASATAMNIVRTLDREVRDDDPQALLLQAVRDANRRLGEIAAADPSVEGMGTTLEAMLWTGEQFITAHIGDSRTYLLRDGELTQLSHDHSFVQSLVDEGRITPEEARVHPHRSLIQRVMIGRPDNVPDIATVDGRAGDRYLLCSDGLTDMVTDADIAPALGEPDLEKAAERLIELALAGGGFDNVTVVIGELVEDGPASSGPASPDPEATMVDGLSALAQPQLVGSAAQATRKREPGAQTAATLAPPPDPEELRYSYVPPERTRWLRYGFATAVVLLAAVIAAVAVFQWTQRQYFVGTDSGKVAIYRGVQANVPLIAVHSVDERTDIDVSQLPTWQRSQVTEGIEAMDRVDAERTVAALRALLPAKDDKRVSNTKEDDKDESPSSDASDDTPTPAPSP
jgi:serine/threonine protein phosphatase PrpC